MQTSTPILDADTRRSASSESAGSPLRPRPSTGPGSLDSHGLPGASDAAGTAGAAGAASAADAAGTAGLSRLVDLPTWEDDGSSRIPFASYTSDALHRRELERFFYAKHWCYVGLEAEIPNPGDFKRTAVGERSVILVRDEGGGINVVENVCAHRGMSFCRERHGNAKGFTCPYHQWNYSLKGDLQGVPFRRGVKQGGLVQGGMPADFDPKLERPHQAEGRDARRRRLRVVRPRRRAVRGLRRPGHPALLRPPVRRPRAEASWATTGSASRATGS